MKNLNCSHEVGVFDNFCGECGEAVKLETCKCKAMKVAGKTFCYECGSEYKK